MGIQCKCGFVKMFNSMIPIHNLPSIGTHIFCDIPTMTHSLKLGSQTWVRHSSTGRFLKSSLLYTLTNTKLPTLSITSDECNTNNFALMAFRLGREVLKVPLNNSSTDSQGLGCDGLDRVLNAWLSFVRLSYPMIYLIFGNRRHKLAPKPECTQRIKKHPTVWVLWFALKRTRTSTPLRTRPSTVRVCQFRHQGLFISFGIIVMSLHLSMLKISSTNFQQSE